uniref:NADH-ubiquinone oxidoreductase chain 4 n=1 Tax=Jaagichlorella roystonensis TaxID=1052852 RepID=A0A6C0M6Z7_9CHLO|nr:NADH dehydrogenase subunit 4 [Jaagichlorella roystonensis]QHU78299.1 NADH dehydrogenase subunit 4 [Jaagichlorella roystonensis]
MSLLLIVLLLPLIGAAILLFIPSWNRRLIKVIGLSCSLITFMVSLLLWLFFDNSAQRFQFLWPKTIGLSGNAISETSLTPLSPEVLTTGNNLEPTLNFILGIDGISLFFVILTTFLIPVCLLVGWTSIEIYVKEYVISFLIMESLMIAVFSVLDLLLFYIFFESVLIPMFIIGVWGSRERKIRAAYQFFLYTLFGSLLMLLAVVLIYFQAGLCDLQTLYLTQFSEKRSILLWLAFFASFAVKVPMIPVHIWLPEAHVEAPTAGSVLLAGIMLKLGVYGFLRFSIPIFPFASIYYSSDLHNELYSYYIYLFNYGKTS